jgi:hypothetical protein
MRLFARIEWVGDDTPDEEPGVVERLVASDVDVALWLREHVSKAAEQHDGRFELDLHIEPVDREE